MSPIYLDCNATTPLEPEVRDLLLRYLTEEYGNEGSRTHEYGARAKRAVQKARDQVAAVVAVQRDEVIFTSGATESNNLAILGLRAAGVEQGRLPVTAGGWVDPDAVRAALRPDTWLVSIMQVNNETGVRQPLTAMVGLKDLVAISNGSACTSSRYSPSHVLKAMGLDDDRANGCVRISWSHLTPEVGWEAVATRIQTLR